MIDRYCGTATEVCIQAMESLGEAEETQVVILTRNSEGRCGLFTNLQYFTDRIGIIQAQLMWEQAKMNKTESEQ